MAQTTFKNLAVLKTEQKKLKQKLGLKYNDTVKIFIDILSKVMEAKSINEFEALKLIKDTLSIYKTPGAPQCFSAALIEITEAKHFNELKK